MPPVSTSIARCLTPPNTLSASGKALIRNSYWFTVLLNFVKWPLAIFSILRHNESVDLQMVRLYMEIILIMYTKRYIGDRIKSRRKELKMTQKELAAKINDGIDLEDSPHTQISQWENGSKIPGTDALSRLCNALNCDIDYLLGAIEEERRATHDAVEYTGLSKEAIETIKKIKDAGGTMGLEILSSLLTNPAFWDAISNINYARFATVHSERPMSDDLQTALLELKMINDYERHPGATILSPEQMRDMNLYQAAQKFSVCAAQISNKSQSDVLR